MRSCLPLLVCVAFEEQYFQCRAQNIVKMSGTATLFGALVKFYDEYNQKTPQKTKLIDAYLMYIMFTGIIQFGYCLLVGTFPFNSFLSGFISCVGSFILAGKLVKMAFTLYLFGCCGTMFY